jgi:hypothetical protein
MDILSNWQTIAAWMLIVPGAALLLYGGRVEIDGITRPLKDPAKVLTWVRGFRFSMIGLALGRGSSSSRWPSAARRHSNPR